jgi:hypothetical protein
MSRSFKEISKKKKSLITLIINVLINVLINDYAPLWKRGERGDFTNIILKSPIIPLCQRGIKTPLTSMSKG